MSVRYSAVKWNRNKRWYDTTMAAAIGLYLTIFFLVAIGSWSGAEAFAFEVVAIRALGTCAYLMLHVVLCIGPLARLDRRFLPVLYNRRHLGVATFLVGLGHGLLTTGYYHGFGRLNPLLSLLTSNTNYDSWRAFPFESLGIGALTILFLLAASSHDFWQKNLGASLWKSLHMAVYVAYALLVMHVVLGALQSEASPVYLAITAVGVATVAGLHLAAAWRERRREGAEPQRSDWVDVGGVDEIANYRAKVVCLPGRERVAVFRYDGNISAVSNVCAHQRGPLGEGKIVDGCITCPWHGWQYRPATGQSPPPFHERIATYRVRVVDGRVLLNPQPLPPGTPVEPAHCEESVHEAACCGP